MEGDIDKSHITKGNNKENFLALLCFGVSKKYAFEYSRGKLRQGRRVILDKGNASKDHRRKGEERGGG